MTYRILIKFPGRRATGFKKILSLTRSIFLFECTLVKHFDLLFPKGIRPILSNGAWKGPGRI